MISSAAAAPVAAPGIGRPADNAIARRRWPVESGVTEPADEGRPGAPSPAVGGPLSQG